MVGNVFFVVPEIAPVRICSTPFEVCMLTPVRGLTEPSGLPLTAPLVNVILPKLETGNCLPVDVLVMSSLMILSWSDAPPIPDLVSVKV